MTSKAAFTRDSLEAPLGRGVREFLDGWMADVVQSWVGYWKHHEDEGARYRNVFGVLVAIFCLTPWELWLR